jgi:hypothetical protein
MDFCSNAPGESCARRPAPGKTAAEVHDYHDVLVPMLAVSLQRRMPGYKRLRFDRA